MRGGPDREAGLRKAVPAQNTLPRRARKLRYHRLWGSKSA